MTRRYSLCCTSRVTLTMMVFSIFALVTTPVSCWRVCRALAAAGAAAAGVSLAIFFPQFTLAQERFYAGEILPRRTQFRHGFGLPGRQLKTQPEDLVGQLALPLVQFRGVLIAHLFGSLGH